MFTESLNKMMDVLFMIFHENKKEKIRFFEFDGKHVFVQKCSDTELFITYEGTITKSFKVDFSNFNLKNYGEFREFAFAIIRKLAEISNQ